MSQFSAMFAVLAVALAASATAQTAAPAPAQPPCSTAQHRQLDFWVGTWIAEWDNANGTKGAGKNVITKDEYGPCVITERFSADDGSLKGFSISTYAQGAREWRQTWMDDQGGYFDLFGGPVTGQPHIFVLETYRRNPNAGYGRMLFEAVTPEGFIWRWQGKATADAAWADRWVIRYTRAPAATNSASR